MTTKKEVLGAKVQFLLIEGQDGEEVMRVVDEAAVSDRIDMDDCYNEPFQVFALLDGKLYEVKYRRQHRINTDEEMPFHYAASDLVANGVVVGQVTHTDH